MAIRAKHITLGSLTHQLFNVPHHVPTKPKRFAGPVTMMQVQGDRINVPATPLAAPFALNGVDNFLSCCVPGLPNCIVAFLATALKPAARLVLDDVELRVW